jgi:DNA ligase D-like protein (predicted ligase)
VHAKATFIEPMLLLKTETLPGERAKWEYGLKLDGYRAIAFTTSSGTVHLRSRNNKDFTFRYPTVVKGLAGLPADTVVDGEIVALDEQGKPSFNLLSHHGQASSASSGPPILYFVFDVLMLAGRDVTAETLAVRRTLLEQHVVPTFAEPIRHAAPLDAALPALIKSVKEYGFEGLVAKRLDSRYEAGLRTGAWRKMRVNQGHEFVIGGYTMGSTTFDALIVGYYDGDAFKYVARVRNGFTPATRGQVFRRFKGLEMKTCPFVNLPEKGSGRFGQGLTEEKMQDCRWLKPALVVQLEYLEWTRDNHLRHTRFVGLRDDKPAREVTRERETERE